MPRTVFLLGVALFLVALAFLATNALLWRPGVTKANVRRIRPGMNLYQVELILGRVPDHTVTRRPRGLLFWYTLFSKVREEVLGEVQMEYDFDHDRVIKVRFRPEASRGLPEGPLDRLRKDFGAEGGRPQTPLLFKGKRRPPAPR